MGMDQTQSFIEEHPEWDALNNYIDSINNPKSPASFVIENCKSLVESILKTILVKLGKETPETLKNLSIAELNKKVKDVLSIETSNSQQIIGKFLDKLNKLRNNVGEVSHGKDIHTLEANRGSISDDDISFLTSTTDSFSSFLLNRYARASSAPSKNRKATLYNDNKEFNEWIDDTREDISILGTTLSPSRVLFDSDPVAYKQSLGEYVDRDGLIEELRTSPSFKYTHSLIAKLSQVSQNNNFPFSREQARKLFEAFFLNNQIYQIARDYDIYGFYKALIQSYPDLLTEAESEQLEGYFKDPYEDIQDF